MIYELQWPKNPAQKTNYVSLHNYISERAVKAYRLHILSRFCLADIFISLVCLCLFLCVFIFFLSLGKTLNGFSSVSLGSASSSESTTLSPLSPHTTTSMPLQGSIRTTRTGDRIHFYQTVCGCRKTDHRAVGCYTAPQDSQSPHHECSSALRQQLTCCATQRIPTLTEEHSRDRHWALLMHNIHLQLPKPHLSKGYYAFSSYFNCSWCTITGWIIQYCYNKWTKFELTHK